MKTEVNCATWMHYFLWWTAELLSFQLVDDHTLTRIAEKRSHIVDAWPYSVWTESQLPCAQTAQRWPSTDEDSRRFDLQHG